MIRYASRLACRIRVRAKTGVNIVPPAEVGGSRLFKEGGKACRLETEQRALLALVSGRIACDECCSMASAVSQLLNCFWSLLVTPSVPARRRGQGGEVDRYQIHLHAHGHAHGHALVLLYVLHPLPLCVFLLAFYPSLLILKCL